MAPEKLAVVPGMRERMSMVRKQLNLSQFDFAQTVGCHRNRISDIERKLRDVPKSVIFALCRTLNVDLNWLFLGIGDMFMDETEYQPQQLPETLDKQIELLEMLLADKDKLIDEKDARIRLLAKIHDLPM